jgi:hypothetical protein
MGLGAMNRAPKVNGTMGDVRIRLLVFTIAVNKSEMRRKLPVQKSLKIGLTESARRLFSINI